MNALAALVEDDIPRTPDDDGKVEQSEESEELPN